MSKHFKTVVQHQLITTRYVIQFYSIKAGSTSWWGYKVFPSAEYLPDGTRTSAKGAGYGDPLALGSASSERVANELGLLAVYALMGIPVEEVGLEEARKMFEMEEAMTVLGRLNDEQCL